MEPQDRADHSMIVVRMTAALALIAVALLVSACSRQADEQPPQPTPRPNLRADSERLQSAINKAAAQRKQDSSPAPTATPQVP